MSDIASHSHLNQEIVAMEALQEKVNSIWSLRFARLIKDKAAITGALILLTLIVISYLSPLLTYIVGLDGSTTDLLKRFDIIVTMSNGSIEKIEHNNKTS